MVDEMKKKKPNMDFFQWISRNHCEYILATVELLIVGDFNFWVDDFTDSEAVKFMDLLGSFNLKQHEG